MKQFFSTSEDEVFQIGPTPVGRLTAALERAFVLVGFVGVGAAIFFLPDYFGRLRHQQPEPGFYGWLLLICAGFVGLVSGLVRFLRKEVWVIDLDEQVFVYETSRLLGGFQQAAIDLEDIDRVALDANGFPGESRLVVEIDGGAHVEYLCRTRFGSGSTRQVAENLRDFIEAHDWDIEYSLGDGAESSSSK